MTAPRGKLRIAVLLSGNGTTLQNILDLSAGGELDAEVVCVVSSRADAYGLERAKAANIPGIPIVRSQYPDMEAYNASLWETVSGYRPDLVVLAGFMSLIAVPDSYAGRIMNVHPALIPAFCGKGMYGHHVHKAVIDRGVKLTGVTVHFVDDKYDHGPIVLQESVPVFDDDTPESIAERVQSKERELYPKAIQLFAEGRLSIEGRRVRLLNEGRPK